MKPIQHMLPQDAYQAMSKDPSARLLDVRDPIEARFVGAPPGAINVPFKWAPDMRPNPEFLQQVGALCPDLEQPLYLLCRSGQRSLAACDELAKAGYQVLINIREGFEGDLDEARHRSTVNGWRYRGLPWEQN